MNTRTTFKVGESPFRISYETPVVLTGSCFAGEIGKKMKEGKMKVLINPTGTVYNPVSIAETIRLVAENRILGKDDLLYSGGRYLSFLHYTDFNSENCESALEKINRSTSEANSFLKDALFLIITFGTARVYRYLKSRKIVSNCHKLPHDQFSEELLSSDMIITEWKDLMDMLSLSYPGLRLIFTVSPVRHWKDGAHGNQVSKSHLFVAIEELLKHPVSAGYFPAYELLMDDLRDYRYYADDMLHPSGLAVDYIWEAFTGSFFDTPTLTKWKEIRRISEALGHRPSGKSASEMKEFSSSMIAKIHSLAIKYPDLDLSAEESYFRSLGF